MEPWLRWNRRTTERLREGQEPWPSRHSLNRGQVYFFLTSIRHPTVLRLWNGIYVLRLFIWSSVSFAFFFFFFLVLLSFWFIQQSYSYWHNFLTTVTFKSVRTTYIILISIGCLIKRTDTRAMKYIIRRKWNY